MARSSDPRDRPLPARRPSVNRGRCLDCGTPTRHPELCSPCVQLLAGERAA